ncbi:MAG: hypothetical protein HY013_16160 [Candidatus Solibacter usitatus]|nr:hypothetical protein [Candidatus Solibacter usitatus]
MIRPVGRVSGPPAKVLCSLLLLTGSTAAQIYVTAPSPRLISGESVQLAASMRNSDGSIRQGVAFNYNSNDTSILAVDARGVVTGKGLGLANILVDAGGPRTSIRLQVLPKKIQVLPADKEIAVGDTLQYTATALDTAGKPIPGTVFQWQVTNANGNNSTIASVRNGLLTASAAGRFTVRAMVNYNTGTPFVAQYVGLAHATAKPRADYRLTRLLSTEEVRTGFDLRPNRVPMTANDQGQVAFVGLLDGLSSGLLLYDNGRIDLLASTGQPGPVAGGIATNFSAPAINNLGQVLVYLDSMGQGGSLLLASRAGVSLLIADGQSGGADFADLRNFAISRQSLNDAAEVLFRASFLPSRATQRQTGLFRLSGGRLQVVWTTRDALPGLTGAYSFGGDFGLTNQGSVWFTASDVRGRAVFRVEGFDRPVRMLGIDSDLDGSTVRVIAGNLVAAADGDAAIQVVLGDGSSRVAHFNRGAWRTLALANIRAIQAVNAAAGVAIFGDDGRGLGLYRWQGDDLTPVLFNGRLAPNQEPITVFDAAALTSDGRLFAQIRTTQNSHVVVEPGGANPLLYQAGNRVDVVSNLLFRALLPGARTGGPLLLMGDFTNNVFQVEGRTLVPRLVQGDRLPFGEYTGLPANARGPSGDYFLSYGSGLYRLGADGVSLVMGYPVTGEDGAVLNSANALTVNSSGHILSSHNAADHQRLALFRDGVAKTLATYNATNPRWQMPSPAGGMITGWSQLALDDTGRVMAFLSVQNGPSGYFLHDGARWQAVAVVNTTQIQGYTVTGIGAPRAAGDSFYAIVNLRGGPNQMIAQFRAGDWTPRVQLADITPEGSQVTFLSAFDVNRRGEILFFCGLTNGASGMYLKSGSTLRLINNTTQPGEGEDEFQRYFEINLLDDRRAYFTAFTIADQLVLYVAEPLF